MPSLTAHRPTVRSPKHCSVVTSSPSGYCWFSRGPTSDAPRFGRVVTAMVTPFDAAGRLDIQAAADLARWLAAHGSDGLVLSGSTGESSVLTDEEKADLWRAVADVVTIPVIAGTGS